MVEVVLLLLCTELLQQTVELLLWMVELDDLEELLMKLVVAEDSHLLLVEQVVLLRLLELLDHQIATELVVQQVQEVQMEVVEVDDEQDISM